MAQNRIKDTKERREQKRKRTGFILTIFLMFILLVLMSSFVLRYIYRGASNVQISQNGVSEVYQAAIGQVPYSQENKNKENQDEEEEESYYEEDLNYTNGNGIYNENSQNSKQSELNSNSHSSDSNSLNKENSTSSDSNSSKANSKSSD